MTTVLGIKASQMTKGIVLFADTQAGKSIHEKVPLPILKIYKPNEYYALAYSGCCISYREIQEVLGNHSRASAERLREQLEDRLIPLLIPRLIPHYHQKLPRVDLLVGMRLDGLALYHVSETGRVVKVRKYKAIGSGQDYANTVLQASLNGGITLEKAIEAGYKAEKAAFGDINTGGFINFAVITEKEIHLETISLTRRLQQVERQTVKAAIERCRKHLSQF
jgi:20S proteasome alpha/beta subunit